MFIILLKIELKMKYKQYFFSSDEKSGFFKNSYKYLYIVIIYGE